MSDELKDQRVVTMMSPSELKTIDDWMFANRIRSRGEAIRRLCQIGMVHERSIGGLVPVIQEAAHKAGASADQIEKEVAETDDPLVLKRTIHRLIVESSKAHMNILHYAISVLLETLPLRTRLPTNEAMNLANEAVERIRAIDREGGRSGSELEDLLMDLLTKVAPD